MLSEVRKKTGPERCAHAIARSVYGVREKWGDKVCVFTDALSRCEKVMVEIFGERTFQGTVEINFRREGYASTYFLLTDRI